MNFANLDQYKQNGDSGDFFEFKFEWDEREDELDFFNFKERAYFWQKIIVSFAKIFAKICQ